MTALNGTPANTKVNVSKEQIEAGALDPKNMGGYVRTKADQIIPNRSKYLLAAEKELGH